MRDYNININKSSSKDLQKLLNEMTNGFQSINEVEFCKTTYEENIHSQMADDVIETQCFTLIDGEQLDVVNNHYNKAEFEQFAEYICVELIEDIVEEDSSIEQLLTKESEADDNYGIKWIYESK